MVLMVESLPYKILGGYIVPDGLSSSSTSVPYLLTVRRLSFERVSEPDPVIFIFGYAKVRANRIREHSYWKDVGN